MGQQALPPDARYLVCPRFGDILLVEFGDGRSCLLQLISVSPENTVVHEEISSTGELTQRINSRQAFLSTFYGARITPLGAALTGAKWQRLAAYLKLIRAKDFIWEELREFAAIAQHLPAAVIGAWAGEEDS